MLKRLLLLVLLAAPLVVLASPTILVFGDSLSAGYGIAVADSWPALLAKRLIEKRLPYSVANASISGETTAGGLARLPAALQNAQPVVVVIALGANDGLRGLPIAAMRRNLIAMIRAAKTRRAKVLLVGMKLPPNYGPDYARQFDQAFVQAAQDEHVALLPFLLEPIALATDDFQADGLHPTAAAQPKLLDHIWPALRPLLK
jgi:acyl-CoA thioesterase-1